METGMGHRRRWFRFFGWLPAGLILSGLVLGLAQPGPTQATEREGPRFDSLRLELLAMARTLDLDMSRQEVVELLLGAGLSIEQEGDLPPNGLTRMLLAVPAEDDCLPRGAPFVCSNIRVNFRSDPQRGLRVVRIEAFQTIAGGPTVAEILAQVAGAMRPPLQTGSGREMVRGGTVSVWRQRWREGEGQGPLLEILAAQKLDGMPPQGITNPQERAAGVGYLRADPDVEGSSDSGRRRQLSGVAGG